ncbi:MAG: radical SAM protein [Candidatus Omnitrophica bacterium]|nr:radical SAM protein [Candidatus Omnitrophota bacterium]
MNERDSEEVLGMLTAQGYEIAEQPEAADVILLNTCSVRQHAEDRAMGKMFELSELKTERPDLVLGIIGCMAKLRQDKMFKRLPRLDLVAGPAELYDLPYLLAEIQEKRQHPALSTQHSEKTLVVGRQFRPLDQKPAGDYRKPGVRAFVAIMEGCDKACTYCIVPKTRGQEISRPAEEIIAEIQALHRAGYQDVTLLGQNVNSYGKRFPDGSGYRGPLGRMRLLEEDPDSLLDFPTLLRMIDREIQCGAPAASARSDARSGRSPCSEAATNSAPGRGAIEQVAAAQEQFAAGSLSSQFARRSLGRSARSPSLRIRFTTSHPFDANERLFRAMAECGSVCEQLHLPVQSGSNRILRAMRRGYTAEQYLAKIRQLRALIPDISLSTDIIVGFPGETDEDFQATAHLLEEVRFENAYIFKYSPRPGTDAAAREDDVPQEVKEQRNQTLLALKGEIEARYYRAFEGQVVEILIEERGRFARQWFGRTRGNHGVIVESSRELFGQAILVRITRATAHTLFGTHEAAASCAVAA